MNFADMRLATYDRIDIQPTDPLMTPDKVGRFVNQAAHSVTMERDWPWLQVESTLTTVAGQNYYPLGVFPGWVATRELVLTWGPGNLYLQPLQESARLALDDRYDLSPQQRPYMWAIFGEQIILAPMPDQAYSIIHRYDVRETDMVQDTDSLLMPAEFHQYVCDLAAFYCLRRDREDPQAKMNWDSYMAGMKLMVRRHRRVIAPLQIRVRPGSGFGGGD